MKKRFWSVFLVTLTALLLFACGEAQPAPQSQTTEETISRETKEQTPSPEESKTDETAPPETDENETITEEGESWEEGEPWEEETATEEIEESGPVAHVHQYGNWNVVQEASCVDAGQRERTCSCGVTVTQFTPTVPHSYRLTGTASQGLSTYSCTVCKHSFAAPKVSNPLTWDRINAIPVATDDMTTDQLRQIVVDFMRLQLEFQWTPNKSFEFLITYHNRMNSFPATQGYAGLPYASNNSGAANLYNLMNYYDETSGVIDVDAAGGGNGFKDLLGTHCSSSTLWAWSRVCNTAKPFSKSENGEFYGGLSNAKMIWKNGFIPVGPHTYDKNLESWDVGDGTKGVCDSNGAQKIYQSYANMLPGDGLITLVRTIPGKKINHLQMLCAIPEVKYNRDGTIDGNNSYLTILEQTSTFHPTKDSNGKTIQVQGGIDARFSFKRLFDGYYIPFTFAEFHKDDPVEQGEAYYEFAQGDEITFENLANGTLRTNYAIAEIFLSITNADGVEVYQNTATPDAICSFLEKGKRIFPNNAKMDFASGNTITLSVRLNNGEIVIACEETIP